MTASTPNPTELHQSSGQQQTEWETVAKRLLWQESNWALDEFQVALHQFTEQLEQGDDPTADDLKQLRNSLIRLQTLIEEEFAPLVDDTEPWERAAHHIPAGALRETLGITREQLRQLDD